MTNDNLNKNNTKKNDQETWIEVIESLRQHENEKDIINQQIDRSLDKNNGLYSKKSKKNLRRQNI